MVISVVHGTVYLDPGMNVKTRVAQLDAASRSAHAPVLCERRLADCARGPVGAELPGDGRGVCAEGGQGACSFQDAERTACGTVCGFDW